MEEKEDPNSANPAESGQKTEQDAAQNPAADQPQADKAASAGDTVMSAAPAKEEVAPEPGSEKRRCPRRIVHERCPLILIALDKKGELTKDELAACALDISSTGIGILAVQALKLGTKVKLTFQSPDYQHTFTAVVRWCRELPTTNRIIKMTTPLPWRAGLEFIPINGDEEKVLARIADQL